MGSAVRSQDHDARRVGRSSATLIYMINNSASMPLSFQSGLLTRIPSSVLLRTNDGVNLIDDRDIRVTLQQPQFRERERCAGLRNTQDIDVPSIGRDE